MEIGCYVHDVVFNGQHPNSFPDCLDIPKNLVDHCYALYRQGERDMVELGTVVTCAPNGALQFTAATIRGAATGTGINLPATPANTDVGDLHCHPSASIGHKDGFAAHSPQDVVSMRDHDAKPLFMRFVCSGTKIYLMVHRNGHSVIDPAQVFGIGATNDDIAGAYFRQYAPHDEDEIAQILLGLPDGAHNGVMRDIRRKTPGLGKEMERLSVDGGRTIANRCRMGFYAGDQGYGISVATFGYLRLSLQ